MVGCIEFNNIVTCSSNSYSCNTILNSIYYSPLSLHPQMQIETEGGYPRWSEDVPVNIERGVGQSMYLEKHDGRI